MNHSVLTTYELEQLLQEDVPFSDLTVDSLGIGKRSGNITFYARDAMVVCGIEEAARLFELAGASPQLHLPSGELADPGVLLMSANGPAEALFKAWKVAQSLVESSSGISTAVQQLVDAAQGTTVACTRKHFPGIKAMVVKAVRSGGASMHRLGLSETVMVAAEHRLFLDDAELSSYQALLRSRLPEKRCVVEVDTVSEAMQLLEQGCDIIQLEKLAPSEVEQVCLAAKRYTVNGQRTVIAAAGGINRLNAAEYAKAGADVLVTSSPFFAGPKDVQVRFTRL